MERSPAIDAYLSLSLHVKQRCAQRNITEDEIVYAVKHGKQCHNAGTLAFYLRRRDIPPCDRSNQRLAQLEGLMVLTQPGHDGTLTVVTAYRNRKSGLKDHRRKRKYRRRDAAA